MMMFNFKLTVLLVVCFNLAFAQDKTTTKDSQHQQDRSPHTRIIYGNDYINPHPRRHGDGQYAGFDKYHADDFFGDPYYDDYFYDDYYGDVGSGGYYDSRLIACEKLSDPENGYVKQRGVLYDAKAIYSCDEGYILKGTKVRVCQRNGKFSDDAPTCEPIDCGQPPSPDNGAVKVNDTTLGNTANQTCNEGYDFNGDDIRECLAIGLWSGDVAQCTPVDCGDPDAPDDNGSVNVTSTTLNSTANYSCNSGYNLVGIATVTCTTSGEWSDGAPTCQSVDCGDPDAPDDNGSVNVTSTTLNSTANYSCNSGYDLVGTATVTCTTSGEWSDGAPTCQSVNCGDPDAPDDNGSVNVTSTTFGSTAIYSCNEGYIINGTKTVICQANETWSDTAPMCKPVDCGVLSDPKNGNVVTKPDTTLNSVATYSCIRHGLKLVGNKNRICETNGNWSGDAPVCEIIKCPKLEAPKYGKIYIYGYYPGHYVVYRCGYGYYLDGGRNRRICQPSGEWSGTDIVCKKN